jgi:hypothetical protein
LVDDGENEQDDQEDEMHVPIINLHKMIKVKVNHLPVIRSPIIMKINNLFS